MVLNKQLTKKFYLIGISYKKADSVCRGQFSLDAEQQEQLLADGPNYGLEEMLIISTCNRTEIYGFAYCVHQLIYLLCKYTGGSADDLQDKGYIEEEDDAIDHLFRVAGGLDSQILGDYEIVGQIKQAARTARKQQRLGAFTERLISTALSASKDIKNKTLLSSGTVSVSYAAVQYLHEAVTGAEQPRILMVGAGKIGASTCKNLISYTGFRDITILNRTLARAEALAAEYGLQARPFEGLDEQIAQSDVVILATSSPEPLVRPEQLAAKDQLLIIDLSIPRNVAESVWELDCVSYVDVDELSRATEATLEQRLAEVPKAEKIIAGRKMEFDQWREKRKHAPFLRAMKETLENMESCPYPVKENPDSARREIHQIVKYYAQRVGDDPRYGCYFVEAIKQYMDVGSTTDHAQNY